MESLANLALFSLADSPQVLSGKQQPAPTPAPVFEFLVLAGRASQFELSTRVVAALNLVHPLLLLLPLLRWPQFCPQVASRKSRVPYLWMGQNLPQGTSLHARLEQAARLTHVKLLPRAHQIPSLGKRPLRQLAAGLGSPFVLPTPPLLVGILNPYLRRSGQIF
ncbi:hypothetical protein I3843_12G025100 [Carya illinoinensis]|nr:hypothetical protein I3843_12G025100 [Carya illinoinensis]